MTIKALSAKIKNGVHLEAAKDYKAVVAYCSKEETRVLGPWSYGEIKEKGGDRKSIEYMEDIISVDLTNKEEVLKLTPY